MGERWGDTHFARSFARSLQAFGFTTKLSWRTSWDEPRHQMADIALHIRGLHPSRPISGQFNVLWIISHPADVTADECDRFDLVFVASEAHAAQLRTQVQVPVHTLLQATDKSLFQRGPAHPEWMADVAFVGNARGEARPSVRTALEAGLEVAVYGWGWESHIPSSMIKAYHVRNDQLAQLYRSVGVVLNDHHPDMADAGFISNRIFDALSCGAAIVSDPVPGMDELFGTSVPTFTTPSELIDAIGRAKSITPPAMDNHTFDARAQQFVAELRMAGANIPADHD